MPLLFDKEASSTSAWCSAAMMLEGRSQKRGWHDGREEEEAPTTVRSVTENFRYICQEMKLSTIELGLVAIGECH
jgi:hypothetical protein